MTDFDLEELNNFSEFFDEIGDEFLLEICMSSPQSLHRMCILLSLDLQLEKEYQSKSRKKYD